MAWLLAYLWPEPMLCSFTTSANGSAERPRKNASFLGQGRHQNFEDSPIPLEKWLVVVWMLSNCRNGVSSYEIGAPSRYSEVRLVHVASHPFGLQSKDGGKLGGGPHSRSRLLRLLSAAKQRNMHKSRRARMTTIWQADCPDGRVWEILERGGKVKATVLGNQRKKSQMQEIVRENVVEELVDDR